MKVLDSFNIEVKVRCIFIFTIVIMVVGFYVCTVTNLQQELTATNSTSTLTQTILITQASPIFLLTETQYSPTFQITESINHPDLPEPLLVISEEGQISDTFKGNLLLNDLITNSAITIDFSLASHYPIVPEPHSTIKWIAISPNNDKAFYIRLGTETTFGDGIMSFAEDEPTIQIEVEDCLWFKGWLDNDHILCFDGFYRKVNISNGEETIFSLDLPDMAVPIGTGAGFYTPVFSPDLSHLVYLSEPGYDGANIILWDIQHGRLVKAFSSENNPFGGKPEWSHSGQNFIFTLQKYIPEEDVLTENLYMVNKNGEIIQLTNLDGRRIHQQKIVINHYQWAPDDEKIAFWLSFMNENGRENKLVILDISTKEFKSYPLDIEQPSMPVWSPDGNAVVVSAWFNERTTTLAIDLETDHAYILTGSAVPIGWTTGD